MANPPSPLACLRCLWKPTTKWILIHVIYFLETLNFPFRILHWTTKNIKNNFDFRLFFYKIDTFYFLLSHFLFSLHFSRYNAKPFGPESSSNTNITRTKPSQYHKSSIKCKEAIVTYSYTLQSRIKAQHVINAQGGRFPKF